MDPSTPFAEPKTLRSFIGTIGSNQDQWLYIPASTGEIEFSTLCYRFAVDASELSPDQQDTLDAYPESVGLKCFLCASQLDDIVGNLRQQRPHFSEQDLIQAINYYWRNDAFFNLAG